MAYFISCWYNGKPLWVHLLYIIDIFDKPTCNNTEKCFCLMSIRVAVLRDDHLTAILGSNLYYSIIFTTVNYYWRARNHSGPIQYLFMKNYVVIYIKTKQKHKNRIGMVPCFRQKLKYHFHTTTVYHYIDDTSLKLVIPQAQKWI